MPLSTDPRAIKAYQAAFNAAQRVAARVDVMRWEGEYYFGKYRSALRQRPIAEIEAVKIGFVEGFEAGQNGKASRYLGRMTVGARLPF